MTRSKSGGAARPRPIHWRGITDAIIPFFILRGLSCVSHPCLWLPDFHGCPNEKWHQFQWRNSIWITKLGEFATNGGTEKPIGVFYWNAICNDHSPLSCPVRLYQELAAPHYRRRALFIRPWWFTSIHQIPDKVPGMSRWLSSFGGAECLAECPSLSLTMVTCAQPQAIISSPLSPLTLDLDSLCFIFPPRPYHPPYHPQRAVLWLAASLFSQIIWL